MNNNNGIPTIIKSGHSIVQEPKLDSIYDVGGMLMVFFEDTLKIAEKHATHSNRPVTQEDLEKGFKIRAIYEEYFWTQQDVLHRAVKHKTFLKENTDSSINNIPETIVNQNIPESLEDEIDIGYTENSCFCRNCQWFVGIEEKWENWKPEKHYQQILKSNFDSVFE
jgi:hypothetical protein